MEVGSGIDKGCLQDVTAMGGEAPRERPKDTLLAQGSLRQHWLRACPPDLLCSHLPPRMDILLKPVIRVYMYF